MNRTVNVLLVEDNDIDREGVRRAFRRNRISNPIHDAHDGIEALEMLRGVDGGPPLARPYIILLDINMPRMNGVEFLQQIRADEKLRSSVVFVLTTSSTEEEKLMAYSFNVAGYIVKRDVGAGFIRLVELLQHYWTLIELPEGKS
jgi:CheY-like chemotaxis protein